MPRYGTPTALGTNVPMTPAFPPLACSFPPGTPSVPCDTAPRCEPLRPPRRRKGPHWQSFVPPRPDHPAVTVVYFCTAVLNRPRPLGRLLPHSTPIRGYGPVQEGWGMSTRIAQAEKSGSLPPLTDAPGSHPHCGQRYLVSKHHSAVLLPLRPSIVGSLRGPRGTRHG